MLSDVSRSAHNAVTMSTLVILKHQLDEAKSVDHRSMSKTGKYGWRFRRRPSTSRPTDAGSTRLRRHSGQTLHTTRNLWMRHSPTLSLSIHSSTTTCLKFPDTLTAAGSTPTTKMLMRWTLATRRRNVSRHEFSFLTMLQICKSPSATWSSVTPSARTRRALISECSPGTAGMPTAPMALLCTSRS